MQHPSLKSISLIGCLILSSHLLLAQTDEKVQMEQVKQQCNALPLDKRARLSVTRFTVTTVQPGRETQQNANANNRLKALGTVFNNGNAPQADKIPPILGDNMTTMLTNALQGVNCYRVLETLSNNKDLTGESKSVSVLGLVNTGDTDPAVAAVLEDGIVEAVQYMAKVRDSLNITADGAFAGNAASNGEKSTEITLSNANFSSYTALANIISGAAGFKSMEKSFTGGVGTYSVTHSGSTDDLLTQISKKLPGNYEVTGEDAGKIDLKVK